MKKRTKITTLNEKIIKSSLCKIFLLIIFYQNVHSEEKGLILFPVCDLVGDLKSANLFGRLGYINSNKKNDCPRIYQGLYNETVDIVFENDYLYGITFDNVKYKENSENRFYVEKKHIKPLKKIDHLKNLIPKENSQYVTLYKPIRFNNFIFSAGTKLVFEKYDTECKTYKCKFIGPNLKIESIDIKEELCIENISRSDQDKIELFLKIIKSWAPNKNGFIPYVWGGASYSYRIPNNTTYRVKKDIIDYQEYLFNTICGMDCSSMILRAAQIAGINYSARNTAMIPLLCTKISPDQAINNGDLICFKGHVIVILDTNKKICLESRGYEPHGFGKIHVCKLNKLFKNVDNFNTLQKYLKNNTPLLRLNKKGVVIAKIKEFGIYRII